MITFNVTNFSTVIFHKLRKQAISFWIDEYPEILHPRFNQKIITDSIELILNNNAFQFDKVNYI